MKGLSKDSASWHEVEAAAAGQRIDNYLTKHLKGVPKSHIYRILRSGEVRVNSRRVAAEYRLEAGDRLRLPPVRAGKAAHRGVAPAALPVILHEDTSLLIVDKPAGVAVHGGSGVSHGVIERVRAARPHAPFLELAHRLDRETSGVLVLAKRRPALIELHRQLREGRVGKYYIVVVRGRWLDSKRNVRLPLERYLLQSGERRVGVSAAGAASHTVFRLLRAGRNFSVLEAELRTGRTHQIRVHLAHIGYPVIGDEKYGDFALNRSLAGAGVKRMLLHAARLELRHPATSAPLAVEAPLPQAMRAFIEAIDAPASRDD